MIKRMLLTLGFGLLMGVMLLMTQPVSADGGTGGNAPSPITVSTEITKPSDKSQQPGIAPNGAVTYGPYEMVIHNRYYPWYNPPIGSARVKTDGWAEGNFPQPPGFNRVECESRVSNDAAQTSGTESSESGWGGTECPITPQATLTSAIKPATYTSKTEAFFKWPDSSSGYGLADQSHYES